MPQHALKLLIDSVQSAHGTQAALRIRGGGTKDFYGEALQGAVVETRALQGISSYEPSELVVTVRAGTLLSELEDTLAAKGQYLAFEPPRFAPGGTVGGMLAAGLAGPSRAAVGSVRDFVLGASILTGQGQVLSFGGQVIKNVAGYDVSRLLAGSLGTLGVILEVSLKVLPIPPATATLRFAMNEAAAIEQLNAWGGKPLPLNASAWHQGQLHLRLSGAAAAVNSAVRQLAYAYGGEPVDEASAQALWNGLRDQTAAFFHPGQEAPLWRLSVPATTVPLALPEDPAAAANTLIEWGGAQRWWRTQASPSQVRRIAEQVGGHATLFRTTTDRKHVFAPLSAPVGRIHQALKKSFDPHRLLNPGRMYPDL